MATLTVNAKGQITLTQELLQHLGVTAGQRVEVQKVPGGRLVIQAINWTSRSTQKETPRP